MKKVCWKFLQKSKIFNILLINITLFSSSVLANTEEENMKNYYKNLSKSNYQNYIKEIIDHPIDAMKQKQSKNVYNANSQNANNNNNTCWTQAGNHYGIDPWVLFAYAKTESNFNPKAINKANRNKTYDIGMMQINSIWLPKLKSIGIKESMLYDACQSIYVAAWIIQDNFAKYGTGYHGIVAYNVGNPYNSNKKQAAQNYYNKFIKNYKYLVASYK